MMILLTIIFLVIDIISKLVVGNLMKVNTSVMVIKNFFYITYVRNTGAAWSIFAGETLGLIIISLLIIVFLLYYILKNKPKFMIEKMGYAMILGGAFGNLVDRVVYGYVIDFLDFNIFGYNYPIFNLADSFIFVGVLLLIIFTWRDKDGN